LKLLSVERGVSQMRGETKYGWITDNGEIVHRIEPLSDGNYQLIVDSVVGELYPTVTRSIEEAERYIAWLKADNQNRVRRIK